MTSGALSLIQPLLERLSAGRSRLTIDGDSHATDVQRLPDSLREQYAATPGYYHGRPVSAEELICEMDMAGVDMTLVWQNPAATVYPGDPRANAEALLAANRYIRDSALRFPSRFIPAGWVDPAALGVEGAIALVDILVLEFGFLFVKMNPAQNRFPIDGAEAVAVLDHIVELGAIPVFHYGADTPFTPAAGFCRLAERHPDHPIVGVHMGGGGAGYLDAEPQYLASRDIGLKHPNVRYILSAKRDSHIEEALIAYQLAGAPFRHHLFCGSDAPYGRMTWNFGGYRRMLDSLIDGARHTDARVRANPGLFAAEDAQNYLGGNLARLVLDGYARLLEEQSVSLSACR